MTQTPPEHATSITYRVPYADTDMMGVVYYGNYLTFFERCRNELMRTTGVTYQEMENDGSMLPVIEAHVNYHSPARYDDLLTITAWVEKVTRVKMKICCIVACGDTRLATGYTVHACVSTQTLRPVRMPEYLQNFGTTCDPAEND